MLLRRLFPALILVAMLRPALATPPDRLDEVTGLLRLPELMQIMAREGIAYGNDLETRMFAGRGGERWRGIIARIYDPVRLSDEMTRQLGKALASTDLAPVIGFFASPLGRRVTGLEVSARRALLDPSVESLSKQSWAQMQDDKDPRLAGLRAFVGANDLIEMNVQGELNASLAFYRGLSDGGAFAVPMTETDLLRNVGSQETRVRSDTTDWIYSYLAMAYQPLSDADLAAYTAFSRTPGGKALNRAMFAAFAVMFRDISGELGRSAAKFIAGEDL